MALCLARYHHVKVRRDHHLVSVAVIVAVGVKRVISDAHEGLKAVITKIRSATWQRCRRHFMRNAMAHAGKTQRCIVFAWVGTGFAQLGRCFLARLGSRGDSAGQSLVPGGGSVACPHMPALAGSARGFRQFHVHSLLTLLWCSGSTKMEVALSGSRLVNRNVIAARGRTSMRLEPELWDALTDICRREHIRIGELVRRVEARGHAGGRTSAIRVFIVEYFRKGASIPADVPPAEHPALDTAPVSFAA